MSGSNVQVQVISTAEEFTRLQAEWDDLYERAEAPRLSQSFEWQWYVWETLALPVGGRLFCIAIRRSDRLVLAWPMVIVRHKRLWTVATSLGSPEDYAALANASSRVNTFGQVSGFALLFDNKIIATQISLLNPHMTENIHIAYDFAYARFSPGLLLDRYVLQWAFERRIAYDFHFGTDDRKRALGNANCDVVTSNYYRTAWAWVYEYLRLCRSAQLVRRLRRW